MQALEAKNIYKAFTGTPVVQDFSLQAAEGEFITLLGPSGCGKTTSLRLLAGFERPDAGSISIRGKVVADRATYLPADQRRVGMVFQDYALFPHVDVAGNIAFGLQGNKSEKAKRAQEMLTLVGLEGYGDRMPYALSGGQQQRVALARALAPQPDVMLLDEPFSNLDTALRAQVRAEVRTILRQAGTTTIFVTHDQEEALSLSDRIVVIFSGKIHQTGTPAELYTRPASKEVASFIGEANFIPAQAHGGKARSILGDLRLLTPRQGDVQLLVRPEALHLQPTDAGTPAQVIWREYYGHNQRIGLRLGDGSELIARTDTQITVTIGQQVRVSVYAPLLAF
jgi:iron(III) transport system ATP-binding protein